MKITITPNKLIIIITCLMVVMFAINIGVLVGITHVQQSQNAKHSETNATLHAIESQMTCLGKFFEQPASVRARTDTNSVEACQPSIMANK